MSAFVVRLSPDGALDWSTFFGDAGDHYGTAIAVDASNIVYVAGYSSAGWGTGPSAYTNGWDGFVTQIDPRFKTFLPLASK